MEREDLRENEETRFPELTPIARRVGPYLAAAAIAVAGIGYAAHERHAAQAVAAENAQVTKQLADTRTQVQALSATVSSLTSEDKPSPYSHARATASAAPRASAATRHGVAARRSYAQDPRFNKLQAQLDAQGKAIDQTRSDLAGTRSDLASARTELGGSIAKTHAELVVLEKRGQSSYFEFDLSKSKQFRRAGPVGISLRKANDKRQYADLMLMVDDRNLQQKHVNLYQPAMFYQPDSTQPIAIVINQISKDHIHGYVSAPKYRRSELDAMANSTDSSQQMVNSDQSDAGIVRPDQAANGNDGPTLKHRSPQPASEPDQQ